MSDGGNVSGGGNGDGSGICLDGGFHEYVRLW